MTMTMTMMVALTCFTDDEYNIKKLSLALLVVPPLGQRIQRIQRIQRMQRYLFKSSLSHASRVSSLLLHLQGFVFFHALAASLITPVGLTHE
jgi:hypothetical protein